MSWAEKDWRSGTNNMLAVNLPQISCVVVTKGRVELFLNSLQCYVKQTYPNKNLVVLSQGSKPQNTMIQESLSKISDVVFQVASSDLSLGQLRNLSVDLATGDIICQWDDDDLYHSQRLQSQYNALRSDSDNVASIYSSFLKYFRNDRKLYWCDWSGENPEINRYLCGSIMFYKRVFNGFSVFYPHTGPQSLVEEDLHGLGKLMSKGKIARVPESWQYLYCYHGQNIYDLHHHELTLNIESGKIVADRLGLTNNKEKIISALEDMGVSELLHVCSNEGKVFEYPEIT